MANRHDPQLIETLKPLPTAELRRRCAALEEGAQAQSSSGTRQDLLEALVYATGLEPGEADPRQVYYSHV